MRRGIRQVIVFLILFGITYPAYGIFLPLHRTAADDTTKVWEFFSSGDIASVVSGGENTQAAATGAIGIRYSDKDVSLLSMINVVSTVDTVREECSRLILNPISGRGLTSAMVDVIGRADLFSLFKEIGHLHAYFSVSSGVWASDTLAESGVIGGLGLLLYREISGKSDKNGTNSLNVAFEAGFIFRSIMCDLRMNKALIKKLLGTKNTDFYGVEMGLSISVNRVTASLQYYLLWPDDDVKGLNSGQIMAGIRLTPKLFTIEHVGSSNSSSGSSGN